MTKDPNRSATPNTVNASALDSPSPHSAVFARLSLMMFLQYFVQGAYQPVVSVYLKDALGFTNDQLGAFSAAIALGPIVAPFFVGQIVDRYFPTQRVMAVCHFLGGLLMLALFQARAPWLVILLGTVYSLLYVPTMFLSNAVAFRHLTHSDEQFPLVRLFGTIGFMVPAYLVEFWWLRGVPIEELSHARSIVFAFSGVVGMVMAFYCISLPHTPPRPNQLRKYAPMAVFEMLKQRRFLVLVLASFFVAVAHKFFFVWNSPLLREILDSGGVQGAYEQSISSIGQGFEIGVMAMLGFMLRRWGFKRTMLLGALAYALRCVILGSIFLVDASFAVRMTMACVGQALHGFCFGCFLAAGYMYVDRIAPSDAKATLQTFHGAFVVALGFFLGGYFAGKIGNLFGDGKSEIHNWPGLWFSCAALSAVCALFFLIAFPRDTDSACDEPAAAS